MFRDAEQRSRVMEVFLRHVPPGHVFSDRGEILSGPISKAASHLGFDRNAMVDEERLIVFTALSILQKEMRGSGLDDLLMGVPARDPIPKLLRLMASKNHQGLDAWILDPWHAPDDASLRR